MSPETRPSKKPRIDIIDALRGSALAGILLLHYVEHFDFGGNPANPPAWLVPLNSAVRDASFFLFGGKSYAIFAMMFGLSFFIVLDNAAKRGVDFRWRFLWRLGLLAAIGYIHSLLFCGDFLTVIAVLGLPLVFFHKVGNRLLLLLSTLLILEIPLVIQVGRILFEQGYTAPVYSPGKFYRFITPTFANGNFSEVLSVNLWKGQLAKWWWTYETGRYLQMMGLFIWGLMLGRSRILEDAQRAVSLAKRILIFAVPAFLLLYLAKLDLTHWGLPRNEFRITDGLASMYLNLSQMLIWAAGFVLLYYRTRLKSALNLLVPYGRMSLTCYVTQALVGVPLFYNFGLGLYRSFGPFYSILCGALFLVIHLTLAHAWFRSFHYGPLEWLWRCCTLGSFKTPLRKEPALAANKA